MRTFKHRVVIDQNQNVIFVCLRMCEFWELNQSLAQVNQELTIELHPIPVLGHLVIIIPGPEAQKTRDFYYSVTGKSIHEVLKICQTALLIFLP